MKGSNDGQITQGFTIFRLTPDAYSVRVMFRSRNGFGEMTIDNILVEINNDSAVMEYVDDE